MTPRSVISEIKADELLKMPDDGYRYELVKGILVKMSPAGQKHGKVTMNIARPLSQHTQKNNLGVVYAAETGFKIASDPDTVRAPDVAFVSRERVKKMGDIDGFIPGPPDLAVEVVSPSDLFSEVEQKVFDWLAAGARLVAVANPRQRTITTYRSRTEISVLTEDDVLDCGDVISDFKLPIKGIFD